uniref:Uncharacterized protein n=1 Tax=Panagrolaimus sp. JU765 TaxID=591449 RepID=A0AC34Q955_9BILA
MHEAIIASRSPSNKYWFLCSCDLDFDMDRNDTLLEVHLPFNQHSKLPVKRGVTAREAIGKALEKRNIDPKMCHVCLSADPRSPRVDLKVDLATLVMKLEKKELWVHSEGLQLMSSICHDFKKINFGKCNVCNGVIFMGGYRCERCFFNFHPKCWGQVPLYCDLTEQIPHDPQMANQLRLICDKYGGRSAVLATEILDVLTTDPSPSNEVQHIGGEITRQPAVRRHDTQSHTPYSRDRASSAPNINIIKDEFGLPSPSQTTSMHSGFQHFLTSDSPSSNSVAVQNVNNSRADKPSSSVSLYPPSSRLNPSLSPVRVTMTNSTSTSPTSTCSSPVCHTVMDVMPGPSKNLTPPQSAPPQKNTDEFFPRNRSKSPVIDLPRVMNRPSVGDWEIDANKITFGPKIGSGSFGTVYKGTYFGDVAIKVLNVGNPSPHLLKTFRNEMALLKKTRHTNILNFMGWIREPQLAIVTQWCQGSSLYHHIHVVEPRVEFKMSMILKICRQIVHGMTYLHSYNILHRDLKTNNIFLTDDNTVKIGDFGLATVKKKWGAGPQAYQPTGSILWMAPEVIRMLEPTTRSDVYSFGICLYELLTSRLPYDHINNRDQIIFMVGRGLLKPDSSHLRNDTPSRLRSCFLTCIEYDPLNRPEFEEVKTLLDKVAQNLPKLTKSQSDSVLYKAKKTGDYHSATSTNDELGPTLHASGPRTPKYMSPGPRIGFTAEN